MPAGGSVGAAAAAELDLALVKVLLEVGPLVAGGLPVLALGAHRPAPFQEFLVVADDVFLEHGDVAAGGLDVEVPEQGRADVDGQAVVDQLGDEEPAEVVRREADLGELRVRRCQPPGGPDDDLADAADRQGPRGPALGPLEQVGKRLAPGPLVLVVAGADRDGAVPGGVPADHLGDDVEQLGGHRHDPLPVALGRADHQQRDDLAAGPLILADAQVRQLDQLLPAHPAEPERLDDRPLPEGAVLLVGQAQQVPGVTVNHPHRLLPVVLGFLAALLGDALPDGPVDGELLARLRPARGVQEDAQPLPVVVDVLGQDRQQWLALAGAGGHPLADPALADVEPPQVGVPDRAGRDPAGPALGLGCGPGLQV